MKLLILGDDGRAHALVWKLFNSPHVSEIVCVPGNGGTSQLAPSVDLPADDPAAITRWAFEEAIDLIVPASSVPLQQGLVDEAVSLGVNVCGASQRSTTLGSSRCAAKAFMLRHRLPTAPGRPFDDLATAEKFLASQPMPVIIKADHPSLGEVVCTERYAALAGLHELFAARPLQGSNNGVVIESYVRGPRVVVSAFADGRTAVPLLPTRLYDRVAENDEGPQARGIGAHTNITRYAQLLADFLNQKLIQPIAAGLAQENMPYWGVLGIDCVIAQDGPKLTAIRSSFREGEAEVVLPRLEDDLLPWVQAMIAQRLHELPPPRFAPLASLALGLFARGYPSYFATGGAISGIEDLDEGMLAFHSATELLGGGRSAGFLGVGGSSGSTASTLRVTGGHPLTLVTTGATLAGARGRALVNAERIRFEGRTYRENVGAKEFA